MLVVSQLHLFTLFLMFSRFSKDAELMSDFGFALPGGQIPTVIAFLIFSFVYTPVESIVSLFMNILSRFHEFQADAYAVSKGYSLPLRKALLKLSLENKGVLWPDWMYAAYHYSHPPVIERLEEMGGVADLVDSVSTTVDSSTNGADANQGQPIVDLDDNGMTRKEQYLFDSGVLRKRVP